VTDVRFARSGDVDVAYRAVGDGPIDLVYAQGAATHLEVAWELPAFRRYCERLAEFSRLILFDKRGKGMSERVPGATTLEERMDDVRAVMDAAGSERAAVMGESEGGPLAMLFAATHPERTAALILQGAEVRERTDEDWSWGESPRTSSSRAWRPSRSGGETDSEST
jgi:pimeloyl-ACP methyl ester carboxylesterase